ncbi:phosphohydrolase [Flavobacterium zepuense]|uniref:Phosphohydrolase n=1 Tax=Flavobacterium zepuense TaxID=2593302 RepID=A0A552V199_9FLAO|nr:HD domain-containing protein [Flavobacterium zepuense]TRW24246.1 phosphohydrolase [Flavobacterium zepuense]
MAYPNPLIESLFNEFQPIMGADYHRYKNHVYRVFLNCLLLDSSDLNADKYAIAAVFHDIGIWTNDTIDYLDPSIAQAKLYLLVNGREALSGEITQMIYWHHKTGAYKGKYEQTVETFRRADWIDVTFGLLSFGVERKALAANRKLLPNLGFHAFLAKAVFKNLLKHPLNPLPMFKR